MKSKVNMKIALPVMIGVLVLLVLLKVFGVLENVPSRLGFVGNDGIHRLNGSYIRLSGNKTHTISPSKGSTAVHCEITTKEGSLKVEIMEKESGKTVYEGEISGNATFDVEAEGKVTVKLSTKKHSGSYLFQY